MVCEAADRTICVLALYSGLPRYYQLLSLEYETYWASTGIRPFHFEFILHVVYADHIEQGGLGHM